VPTFTHCDPDHPQVPFATVFRWAVLDRLRGRRDISKAGPPAPWVKPDLELIARPAGKPRLTWLGHSSFLLQVAGRAVLFDPVLSSRALAVPRHGKPGLRLGQLPPIDLILVSHAHYDHLDSWTIKNLPKSATVGVPIGLGDFFRKRGYRAVNELSWWDGFDLGPLRVHLVPARHWANRNPWDVNTTLWGGFLVEAAGHRIYHAGDSAASPFFAEVGRRFPGIDLALLPIGAYEPAWFMEYHHMSPEQAIEAFEALGARRFVPMHWGAFKLTDESLRAPIERLKKNWRVNHELVELAVGQSFSIA
jgi:L-ascorbate metabolism protein UlaG (beta-lactamase superfamily)